MEIRAIDFWLNSLVAILYLAVLVQQVRSMNFFYVPVFCAYLAGMAVQRIWNPRMIRESMWIEPALVALRFCAILEAVSLTIGDRRWRERRWLISLMLASGFLGGLALHGYLYGPSLTAIYRSARQHFHVATALACFVAAMCYALEGVRVERTSRNHFLILGLHIGIIAACGFIVPSPGRGTTYYEIHIAYLAGMATCCALWLCAGPLLTLKLS